MNYTQAEQNLIVLSAIAEMTYNERYAALSALMSFEPDFGACKNLLIKRCGIGVYNKVKDKFYDTAFRRKIFDAIDKRGIECVAYCSEDYPEQLKHVPAPPIVLYIKGRRELLRSECFAIVGSRRSTPTALAQCKYFAEEISKHFTIVTGSATGADSAAIQGAGYRVISVIAFGFDHLNIDTSGVESEGLLVSEHFPTTVPQDFLFPVRNRIIAGLSRGTLIVSVGAKSGALHTANYALDYGREVFAFPYSIGVSSGEGCNRLIKEGANLCENPLDVLSVYGLNLKHSPKIELSEEEARVFEIIKEQGEIFLPTLSNQLGVPSYKLSVVISSLEIKGLVARLGGNRYSVV